MSLTQLLKAQIQVYDLEKANTLLHVHDLDIWQSAVFDALGNKLLLWQSIYEHENQLYRQNAAEGKQTQIVNESESENEASNLFRFPKNVVVSPKNYFAIFSVLRWRKGLFKIILTIIRMTIIISNNQ